LAGALAPEQLSSEALTFPRSVAEADVPEAVKLAVNKVLAKYEATKSRTATAVDLQQKREFKAAFINIEQRRQLRDAGQ
jgi:hypothetical protein